MVLSLHHAQFTIPRGLENEARDFYCGLLGLREVEKPDSLKPRGGFWLQLSNAQVHVGTEDGVEREKTKAHLAFEVDNLLELRTAIERRGLRILEGLPVPGCERFEFRDPFGNRVEIVQRNAD